MVDGSDEVPDEGMARPIKHKTVRRAADDDSRAPFTRDAGEADAFDSPLKPY